VRIAIHLTFLAHQAWDMLDAVGVTLARLITGQGRFLQWETAAAVAARAKRLGVRDFYLAMRASPIIAGIALDTILIARPQGLPAALPIIALWAVAPLIAHRLSKPAPSSRPEITHDDREYLKTVARATWKYFETFVGSDDRWLPPETCSSIRNRASRTGPRRPTSRWACSPRCRRTTSVSSMPTCSSSA
jgi:cyclic beta-1,2-glucan synthetase